MKALFAGAMFMFSAAGQCEGPAVLDGNLQIVGSYVGPSGLARTYLPNPTALFVLEPSLLVVSSTGYVFSILQNRGRISSELILPAGPVPTNQGEGGFLYYTTTNCTGQAFVEPVGNASLPYRGGFVFANGSGAFYSPKSTTGTQQAIRSVFLAGNTPSECSTFGPVQKSVLEVFPNDPQVTGISGPNIPTPITIGMAEVPRVLFKNGFEDQSTA